MLIRNLPDDGVDYGHHFHNYATTADVRAEVSRVLTKAGRTTNRFRVVLRFDPSRDPSERTRRHSPTGRRTIGVTWSAHREFLSLLFDDFPEAVVVSMLATYRGRSDFEHSHGDTYNRRARAAGREMHFGDL